MKRRKVSLRDSRRRPVGLAWRMVFASIRKVVSRLFPRMTVEGYSPDLRHGTIFVSNHLNSFGPMAMMLRFPAEPRPWVLSDVMERGSCSRYIEVDFVRKELGIGRPLSRAISLAIELICVPLMRYVGAIPVYRRNRKVARTFAATRVCLDAGESVVIFPELMGTAYNDVLNRLDNGFVEVLRQAWLAEGRLFRIVPVYVDKARRRLRVGAEISYDPERPFKSERLRIEHLLEEEMSRLAKCP